MHKGHVRLCTMRGVPVDRRRVGARLRMVSAAAIASAATVSAGPATVNIVNVSPGQLHRCAAAAHLAAAAAGQAAAGAPAITRCVLAPGTYRESIEYDGPAPLEIVGAGKGLTLLRGDVPLAGLDWTLSPLHNGAPPTQCVPPSRPTR